MLSLENQLPPPQAVAADLKLLSTQKQRYSKTEDLKGWIFIFQAELVQDLIATNTLKGFWSREMEILEHLKIMLFSDPDYENLVSEIYYDDEYIAFVHQDEGKTRPILVFSSEGDALREIDLHWFIKAIQIAADDLLINSTVPDIIEKKNSIF